MSMCSGIGSSRHPIAARSVDFPHPFKPSNPYRLKYKMMCGWGKKYSEFLFQYEVL